MATTTPNLRLTKPESSDKLLDSLAGFNDNADKLDEAIAGLTEALGGKQPAGDYLTQDNLQSATDAALEQAKASGEFDGTDGITPNIGDGTLTSTTLQGGFAGRTIPIPTTQNTQSGQTLQITVPELVGRPMANIHNLWVDGIADQITGLTSYHGLVAGSVDESNVPHRIFAPNENESSIALEPSPAWEVAEFLIIALDRSGARVEGAIAALGCTPASKVGNDIFTSNNQGSSNIQQLQLTYNCQFVQSAYINDLASRYVKQFAVFGNSLNYNPGAGDAFFKDASSTKIDHAMFNNGERPFLDAVQSGLGNAPVMYANNHALERDAVKAHAVDVADHSRIWTDNNATHSIANPYEGVPNL